MQNLTGEQIINELITIGATITSEKIEESGTCLARRVFLKKNKCKFKVDYIKIGNHEILVQNSCSCITCDKSINYPANCNKLN